MCRDGADGLGIICCEEPQSVKWDACRWTSSDCSAEWTLSLYRGIPYICPWYYKPPSILMCACVTVKGCFIGGQCDLLEIKHNALILWAMSITSAVLYGDTQSQVASDGLSFTILHAVLYALCYLQFFLNSLWISSHSFYSVYLLFFICVKISLMKNVFFCSLIMWDKRQRGQDCDTVFTMCAFCTFQYIYSFSQCT